MSLDTNPGELTTTLWTDAVAAPKVQVVDA
jgi:hypothetical protein